MDIAIRQLIDLKKVDILLEGFNKSTGFVTAILDLEGNVLSKSGWRPICTEFHRINPETSKRCTISDTMLANKMGNGEKYHAYRCLNGLMDVAVPLEIDGVHVANLFSGQFFFEEPDVEFFRKQAVAFGFDEKKYLDALSKVPVVSEEKVKAAMDFLLNMTEFISELAIQKLEQAELNQELKDNEQKFKAVFESANAGKSITSLSGEINVNKAFCKMLGYTRKELENKKWQELTPEKDIPPIEKVLDRLMTGEKDSARFEKRYVCKNGSHTWADVSVSLLRDECGKPLHFITTIIDISDRKKAETELIKAKIAAEKSEIRYRTVVSNSPVVTFGLNPVGVFTLSEGKGLEKLGLKPGEVVGLSAFELYKDYPVIIRDIKKALAGKVSRSETVLPGVVFDILYNPVFDNKGKLIEVIGVANDITERKQAEIQIEKHKSELEEYFENDISADYVVSVSGEIFSCNQTFLNLFGFEKRSETEKFDITELYKNREDRNQLIRLIKKQKKVENHEVEFISKEGKIICALINAIGIFGQDDQLEKIRGYVVDISEQKNVEKELLKLSRAVEQSPTSIIITDLDGNIEYVNPKTLVITGYTKEELIGKNSRIFNSGEKPKEDYQQLWSALLSGREWNGEFHNKKKNGELYWESASISPIINEKQEVINFVAVKEDITERKRLEDTQKLLLEISELATKQVTLTSFLAEVHQKLKQIVRADNFYVALYNDTDHTFSFPYHVDKFDKLELNKPYDFSKGFTDYVLKTNKSLIVTPEYEDKIEKEGIVKIYGDELSVWLGVPFQTKEGHQPNGVIAIQDYQNVESYIETDRSIMEIIAHHIGRFIERIQHLEELVRAKENAEANQLLFETIFESAPVGIALFDAQSGNFLKINRNYSQLLGYSKNEMIGLDFMQISHPEDLPDDLSNMEKLRNGEITYFEMEKRLYSKSGQVIHTNLMVIPLGISESPIETHLAIVQDITNDKKMIAHLEQNNIELISAKERAEESDRLKSAFLANMSHEIRTPMNGILGFTELLLQPHLGSKQKEAYVQIVHQSGQRLLNTVDGIVEISKIEAGIVTVNLREVHVQQRIDELMRFFAPEAAKKGLKLILESELPQTAVTITTDQHKFDSILTNLIKNAIKYTESGTIKVGCDIIGRHGHASIQFYVKDTGIGIPEERQQAIFERFVQADLADKDARQGSGLGLAITKAYVEMLGGKIGLESKNGEGSAFYFTLPLNGPAEERIEEKEPVKKDDKTSVGDGLYILIAEDDWPSAHYLQTILKNGKHKILLTQDGHEAVDACRDNPDVDLVLMDIQMPGMNGYDATREIRKFNKKVVIIAQTAYAISGDKEKALEAGCNDYISKPINKKALLHKIGKLKFN